MKRYSRNHQKQDELMLVVWVDSNWIQVDVLSNPNRQETSSVKTLSKEPFSNEGVQDLLKQLSANFTFEELFYKDCLVVIHDPVDMDKQGVFSINGVEIELGYLLFTRGLQFNRQQWSSLSDLIILTDFYKNQSRVEDVNVRFEDHSEVAVKSFLSTITISGSSNYNEPIHLYGATVTRLSNGKTAKQVSKKISNNDLEEFVLFYFHLMNRVEFKINLISIYQSARENNYGKKLLKLLPHISNLAEQWQSGGSIQIVHAQYKVSNDSESIVKLLVNLSPTIGSMLNHIPKLFPTIHGIAIAVEQIRVKREEHIQKKEWKKRLKQLFENPNRKEEVEDLRRKEKKINRFKRKIVETDRRIRTMVQLIFQVMEYDIRTYLFPESKIELLYNLVSSSSKDEFLNRHSVKAFINRYQNKGTNLTMNERISLLSVIYLLSKYEKPAAIELDRTYNYKLLPLIFLEFGPDGKNMNQLFNRVRRIRNLRIHKDASAIEENQILELSDYNGLCISLYGHETFNKFYKDPKPNGVIALLYLSKLIKE